MLWNVDNQIYITYNMERYQFTDGTWRAEKQPGHWTQWGLTHDDYGKLFWIDNTNRSNLHSFIQSTGRPFTGLPRIYRRAIRFHW